MLDTLPAVTGEFLATLVGMYANTAKSKVITAGFKFRRTRTDGQPHICTQDYNTRRINVWTVNGKITKAYTG